MTTNRQSQRVSKLKTKRSPAVVTPTPDKSVPSTKTPVVSVVADPVNRVIYEPQKPTAAARRSKKLLESTDAVCHSSTTTVKKPNEKLLPFREQQPHLRASFRDAAVKLKAAADAILDSIEADQDLSPSYEEFNATTRDFVKLILSERIRKRCEHLSPNALPSELFNSLDQKLAFADTIRSWLHPWNLGFRDSETGHVHQLFAMSAGNSSGAFCLSQYGSSRENRIKAWSRILDIIADPHLEDITPSVTRQSARSR